MPLPGPVRPGASRFVPGRLLAQAFAMRRGCGLSRPGRAFLGICDGGHFPFAVRLLPAAPCSRRILLRCCGWLFAGSRSRFAEKGLFRSFRSCPLLEGTGRCAGIRLGGSGLVRRGLVCRLRCGGIVDRPARCERFGLIRGLLAGRAALLLILLEFLGALSVGGCGFPRFPGMCRPLSCRTGTGSSATFGCAGLRCGRINCSFFWTVRFIFHASILKGNCTYCQRWKRVPDYSLSSAGVNSPSPSRRGTG